MPRVIHSVLIAGYGTMGRAAARTFADAGFSTTVWSRRAASLADLPPGVVAGVALPEAAPDLIIEFLAEDLELKREFFAQVESAYGDAARGARRSRGRRAPHRQGTRGRGRADHRLSRQPHPARDAE